MSTVGLVMSIFKNFYTYVKILGKLSTCTLFHINIKILKFCVSYKFMPMQLKINKTKSTQFIYNKVTCNLTMRLSRVRYLENYLIMKFFSTSQNRINSNLYKSFYKFIIMKINQNNINSFSSVP